jgi:hypothetical protein
MVFCCRELLFLLWEAARLFLFFSLGSRRDARQFVTPILGLSVLQEHCVLLSGAAFVLWEAARLWQAAKQRQQQQQ